MAEANTEQLLPVRAITRHNIQGASKHGKGVLPSVMGLIQSWFDSCMDGAEELIGKPDQLESLLLTLEKMLRRIPLFGSKLSMLPLLVSMVRSYIIGEYTTIPVASLAAIVGALTYFVSPVNVIPNFIPWVGHIDDGFVISLALDIAADDIKGYKAWRKKHGYPAL